MENNSISNQLDKLHLEIVKAERRFKETIGKVIGVSFLAGVLAGCAITFINNKAAIRHYNQCQEQVLLKSIAEEKSEKNWYIKEGKDGKIKVVQYSENQLDSLTEVTATEQ